jgi:3-methylcrotonyl-CoA carboxylase alpha subunit
VANVTQRIQRLLIANRGEIAVRIARTCRSMGITSIAVYSDADRDSLHVKDCDEALHIGPAPARDSYLNIERVIDAARRARAHAIHPGYGFLSENHSFAQACADAGIIFIGPSAAAMRAVGDKIAAKKAAEAAGVPTVPGYLGEDQSASSLAMQARKIGAPLIIKAAAGGGGKGMRLVRDLALLDDAIESAKREARGAFGDDTVFLERYLLSPRHVEVQILADSHGACIHLNERDCSIQRRHQKIVEESPSPAVTPALRARLGDAAIRLVRHAGYVNAGTVEFMLDANGEFYFLEVNARLQVEHPVTEAITGVDLVREQINIAQGERLSLRQDDVAPRGHAIEARIYAEDPALGFLPSSGRLLGFTMPSGPGVRVDAGVEAGSEVTSDYDPMLAKLITSGESRDESLGRLRAALDECAVAGVASNVEFLRWLIMQPAFERGDVTTDFLERHVWPGALRSPEELARAASASAGALQALGAWRLATTTRTVRFIAPAPVSVELDRDWEARGWRGRVGTYEAVVRERGEHGANGANGANFELIDGGQAIPFDAWRTDEGVEISCGRPPVRFVFALDALEDVTHAGMHAHGHGGASAAMAPMTGTIVKVAIKPGERVVARQVLAVMEAMKMEHAIAAPYDGTVVAVAVKAGDRVNAGAIVVEIEAAGD